MADVMGSGGLAWYQWRKHGRCSGLDPAEYFALARMAVALVPLPEVGGGRTTAAVLESLFLDEGPALDADELIVTCRSGRLAEVASASPANSIRAAARRTCSPTPAIGATR